jgi:predicted GIY-YIG superfamily endonuclease
MKYVYLLQSINHPDQRYTGLTSNLDGCLLMHNAGGPPHTAKYRPWRLFVAIQFDDDARAVEFERYLRSGSGQAFAKRHLW